MFLACSSIFLHLPSWHQDHTHTHTISNTAILGLFSKHFLLSKTWSIHRRMLTRCQYGLVLLRSFQQMSLAVQYHTKAFTASSTNLHFQIGHCARRERRGEIYTFCPRLLGSMVMKSEPLTHRRYAAPRARVGSVLLVSNWTREATPVTAGHGHHHTSRTFGHTGGSVLLKWTSCNSILTAGGVFLLNQHGLFNISVIASNHYIFMCGCFVVFFFFFKRYKLIKKTGNTLQPLPNPSNLRASLKPHRTSWSKASSWLLRQSTAVFGAKLSFKGILHQFRVYALP